MLRIAFSRAAHLFPIRINEVADPAAPGKAAKSNCHHPLSLSGQDVG
jgi:hypothetical protein